MVSLLAQVLHLRMIMWRICLTTIRRLNGQHILILLLRLCILSTIDVVNGLTPILSLLLHLYLNVILCHGVWRVLRMVFSGTVWTISPTSSLPSVDKLLPSILHPIVSHIVPYVFRLLLFVVPLKLLLSLLRCVCLRLRIRCYQRACTIPQKPLHTLWESQKTSPSSLLVVASSPTRFLLNSLLVLPLMWILERSAVLPPSVMMFWQSIRLWLCLL